MREARFCRGFRPPAFGTGDHFDLEGRRRSSLAAFIDILLIFGTGFSDRSRQP
jgi:hypothetical protein